MKENELNVIDVISRKEWECVTLGGSVCEQRSPKRNAPTALCLFCVTQTMLESSRDKEVKKFLRQHFGSAGELSAKTAIKSGKHRILRQLPQC